MTAKTMRSYLDHSVSVSSETFLFNILLVIHAKDSKHFFFNTYLLLNMGIFSMGLCFEVVYSFLIENVFFDQTSQKVI